MNNTRSYTSPTSTQMSEHPFSENSSNLDIISLEIPKLKPKETKLVDKVFDEWLDRTIQILLSDIPEEKKGTKIIQVTTNLASKITHPLHRVHFMILVKNRFHK